MSKNIYLFSTSSYPETIHINPLDTKFLQPEIDFSEYDYLIITSKQVAKALEQYDRKKYIDIPALCVSEKTAQSFEKLGGTLLAVGSGYGDNLAEQIKSYPKKRKWLYLRAKEVASNFAELSRNDGYMIDEAVVYETSCSETMKNIELEDDAVLIFTSPSAVKCFLKTVKIKTTQNVIVIGNTTAKAVPENIQLTISDKTTIESCVKIAKSL